MTILLASLLTGCGGATNTGHTAAGDQAPGGLQDQTVASAPARPGTTPPSSSGSPSSGSAASAHRDPSSRRPASPGELTVGWVHVDGRRIQVLETASGAPLYDFSPDGSTVVDCTAEGPDGGCTRTWAPLLLASGAPWSHGRLPGRLATLRDADGRQVTYAGHPLYTYRSPRPGALPASASYDGQWFFLVTPETPPPRGCPPIC